MMLKKAADSSYNKDTNTDPNHREMLKKAKIRAIMNYAGGRYTIFPTAGLFIEHFLLNTGE